MLRYTPNGILDPSFGQGGVVVEKIADWTVGYDIVAAKEDQQIFVCGVAGILSGYFPYPSYPYQIPLYSHDFLLIAFQSGGNLDSDFGVGGMTITDFGSVADGAFSIALQKNGKLVIGGTGGDDEYGFALARYKPNGSPDTTFGMNGLVVTSFADFGGYIPGQVMVLQPDGKILMGGELNKTVLARYLGDPSADLAVFIKDYPDPAKVNETMRYRILVQNDGPDAAEDVKLAVKLGHTGQGKTFSIVGMNSSQGKYTLDQGTIYCEFGDIQPQGKVVMYVAVAPHQSGKMKISAYLKGHTLDNNMANNSVSEVTAAIN